MLDIDEILKNSEAIIGDSKTKTITYLYKGEEPLYVQCPKCKKGYLTKLHTITVSSEKDTKVVYNITAFYENLEVELSLHKEHKCFGCGAKYVPTLDSRMCLMDEFVADKVMTFSPN